MRVGLELGEIDTYISQHPLVRENVTLVRRDKDEEPTLVSYVVPDMKEWTSWLKTKEKLDGAEDDTMVGMLKRFRLLIRPVTSLLPPVVVEGMEFLQVHRRLVQPQDTDQLVNVIWGSSLHS